MEARALYQLNEAGEATDTLFFCSDQCRNIIAENYGADNIPVKAGMNAEWIDGTTCDQCEGPLFPKRLAHVATESDNINPVLVWSDLAPKERYTLRAIFTDMDAANAFMAENRDTGLLAEFGPFLLVANLKANKAVRRG